MVGYGTQVFNFRNQYWLWCPIIAPLCGAQAGAVFYDAFLYTVRARFVRRVGGADAVSG